MVSTCTCGHRQSAQFCSHQANVQPVHPHFLHLRRVAVPARRHQPALVKNTETVSHSVEGRTGAETLTSAAASAATSRAAASPSRSRSALQRATHISSVSNRQQRRATWSMPAGSHRATTSERRADRRALAWLPCRPSVASADCARSSALPSPFRARIDIFRAARGAMASAARVRGPRSHARFSALLRSRERAARPAGAAQGRARV